MPIAFEAHSLPEPAGSGLRARLVAEHRREPFSFADPRATIQRVLQLLPGLPLRATVFRGGLDLRGAELDHVWLAVQGQQPDVEGMARGAYVLDAALPLFDAGFVDLLRGFVAGDAPEDALEAVAAAAEIDARVVGLFPAPMRYLGNPVWSA